MKNDPARLRWAMDSAKTWLDIERLVPETGIDAVDADHRGILEFALALNILSEDAAKGLCSSLLSRQRLILSGLLDAARRHFEREENLIRKFGAPNLDRQAKEHAKIIGALEDRIHDFMEGRLTISPELRRAVFKWMIDHIAGTDLETFRLTELNSAFSQARNWGDLHEILRSTGVDKLDIQHKGIALAILAALSQLRTAGAQGPGCSLSEVLASCRTHFSDEEAFMESFSIPGLETQRNAHSAFLSRLDALNTLATEGRLTPADCDDLAKELLAWLADHVNRLDFYCFRRGDWLSAAFETKPAASLVQLIRATGNPLVDAEHHEFIGFAAAFGNALGASADNEEKYRSAISGSFDHLVEYAVKHFKDEEACFPPVAEGLASRHKDEHRALSETLGAYKAAIGEGRIGAAAVAKGLIVGWWINHTNSTDIETFGSEAMREEQP